MKGFFQNFKTISEISLWLAGQVDNEFKSRQNLFSSSETVLSLLPQQLSLMPVSPNSY